MRRVIGINTKMRASGVVAPGLLCSMGMTRRKRRSRSKPPATGTPPSISDEQLAESDRGRLFTDDGFKARDTERVGAVAPDTDPPDTPDKWDEHARP